MPQPATRPVQPATRPVPATRSPTPATPAAFDAYLDGIVQPIRNELIAQGKPAPSPEIMKAGIKTELQADKYTPNDVVKMMNSDMGKYLMYKAFVKGLARVGLKGNLVSSCVMAAIEEPGAAIGLASLQIFLGAPMMILMPFVMLFALFWFFFLFALGMKWVARSNKGHEGSRIYWNPGSDTKVFRNFSLFMWGSGLFLFFWTVVGVALGASSAMMIRTLLFTLVPDQLLAAVLR